jgi:enoyl-CoA hydratase
VAAEHARLGHPEVRIGAVAGWGGTTRLARLVGRGLAAELLLTGRTIGAVEALAVGLVNRVVPGARLRDEAAALGDELASLAPHAVRLTWRALHSGLDLPLNESTTLGVEAFGAAAETQDFREGTHAFLEKRPPTFRGA